MSKISVVLTNRFATFERPYPLADLEPYFSFHPPGYRFMPSFRRGHWDGKIRFLRRHKVPTGLFLATKEQIKEDLGVKFRIENRFVHVEFRPTGVESDREYQNECVEAMVQAANRGGGLVLAATGTGKTLTTGLFFHRLLGAGCFIVDELTLLKQAQEELSRVLGEPVGEVGDSKFLPKRITVATSQTLYRHKDDPKFQSWVESLEVNVIDELHLAMNRRTFDIVEAIAPPAVFGLTATLELQKKHVRTRAYALAGPVIYEFPLAQGIKEGHLANGVVLQVLLPGPDDSGYGPRQYAQQYSDQIVKNPERNHIACKLARLAIARDRFPIIVVERIAHLKKLSEALKDIPHRVVCGEKKVEDRIAAKRKFESGKVQLLIVNKVFQKGIDLKRLDVIIDAGAMKNKNRAIQIFGRGVRLHKDKTGLLYFDIADVGNRFEKAGKMRRSAFRKKEIKLKKLEYEGSTKELFEAAEKLLEKALADGNTGEQLRLGFR